MFFIDQGAAVPFEGATNSAASQSSSSGCVGGEPWAPKSFSVSTRPRPKYCCQRRLTVTRAVSGLAGSTIQRARSRRLGNGFEISDFTSEISDLKFDI